MLYLAVWGQIVSSSSQFLHIPDCNLWISSQRSNRIKTTSFKKALQPFMSNRFLTIVTNHHLAMKIFSTSGLRFPKAVVAAAFIAINLSSCRTAELAVNQDLQHNTEFYQVKGRQGSQIGQVISFGSYTSSKVKRGWTFGYSLPFIVRFNGASEKLSFSLADADGKTANVALISRFKATEIEPIRDYFSIALKYKNYFAGTVGLQDSEEWWDFIVHNVDGASRSLKNNATIGFARNGLTKIEIIGIKELEGASPMLTQNEVYGYEFRLDGKIIGAVSVINQGKVWFRKDLDASQKLILAAISSGLMLRSNVEDRELSMN
jgi:hypothetical protein